jgi:hypothetical protein
MRRVAFARKQRAIRNAVRVGDEICLSRKRHLLAACLGAWRVSASVYREVARRLAARALGDLRLSWDVWRAFLSRKVRRCVCDGRQAISRSPGQSVSLSVSLPHV